MSEQKEKFQNYLKNKDRKKKKKPVKKPKIQGYIPIPIEDDFS